MRIDVVVRGVGEIGSAVAWYLHDAGRRVALQQDGLPATIRRPMAFSDAVFDGAATLNGRRAVRVADAADAGAALATGAIPLFVGPLRAALALFECAVLVDARMHKRTGPDRQLGLASLVIGLGPGCVIGGNVDVAVETSWEDVGGIVRQGATLPLRGEPRAVMGFARERFCYAPVAGTVRNDSAIGRPVAEGEVVAWVGDAPIRASFSGMIRGLTRDAVPVEAGTKVAEIDPRLDARLSGIEERPARIAEAVLAIVSERRPTEPA